MDGLSFFLEAIAEVYGRKPSALIPLRHHNPEGKRLYRLDFADEPSLVLRAYHQNHSATDVFQWLSGSRSLIEWLQDQAHILSYLARQQYPAPAVISPRSGAQIGIYKEWYLLVTSFEDGEAKDTSPGKMAALGAALGHLHTIALPEPQASKSSFPSSWWSMDGIQEGIELLTSSATSVPEEGQRLYSACLQTFHFLQQCAPFPQTIIHADCWAENGIQKQHEQATLIDWECAGLGMAIIDFGSFLLHCHFDQRDTLAHQTYPQYQPDPQRIQAAIQGYYRHRQLSSDERAALVEAIRFSAAWRGAWFISLIAKGGDTGYLAGALRRWQRWYDISEEIAHLALMAIEQIEKKQYPAINLP